MAIQFVRVINQQVLNRSILLDKIDKSQGNFLFYAQIAKQKVYVPYRNPLDTSVKGYLDLVQTDEVKLSLRPKGTIAGLQTAGFVTFTTLSSALLATPVVSSGSHAGSDTTINGTTFVSQSPDITYVTFKNLSNVTQKVPQTVFGSISATQIVVPDSVITIGTPTTGWKVTVQANSKTSNEFTLT